jgi:putative transposase
MAGSEVCLARLIDFEVIWSQVMRKKDEQWAIFWCSLLRPVLFEHGRGEGSTHRFLKELSQKEVAFPDGTYRRPSLSTLKRKLRKYRCEGFDALARKTRNDRGRPRAAPREVIDRAVAIKQDLPTRSSETINRFLQAEYGLTLPNSTLYRHLKDAGVTRIKLGMDRKKVRKRWSRNHTHDLWLGDFEEGPYVTLEAQRVVPTHLSAFIDCHSRWIVSARYYVKQDLDILIDTLLRAWAVHGASRQLYVDNAKVYHSQALASACLRLGIDLIHRTAGDAPPGGLIERFFATVQSQFESEVRAGPILSLSQLNRAFSAWLTVSYHQRINADTGQSPQQRYHSGLTVLRKVDTTEAIRSFMKTVTRQVHRDFCDIQLNGRFYRVDRALRGDKVQVRYDPYSTMETVLIYSLKDVYLGEGYLHQRHSGDRPGPEAPACKAQYSYLDMLIRQHEQLLNNQAAGIDYRAFTQPRAWSFAAFVQTFGALLGRKGGLSAFTADELERLKKTYNRSTGLAESILIKAFKKASDHDIYSILNQLEHLLTFRKDS